MSILPLISALGFAGTNSVRPVSANLAATTATLSLFSGDSTVVDLSSLGRLFSAVADFQSRMSVLRPGATDSGIGSNFGSDFASLAAEAQYFVDSVNTLQTSLNELNGFGGFGGFNGLSGLTGLTGLGPAGLPPTRLSAALEEQLNAALDNGESAFTRLADLGIEPRPSVLPGVSSGLGVDLAVLRAAFEADPAGSFALLERAARALESVAGEAAGIPENATSIFAAQLQLSSLELSLNLFDDSFGTAGTDSRPFTDLLTLASLGGSEADSRARLLAALNQFSLVSSLMS